MPGLRGRAFVQEGRAGMPGLRLRGCSDGVYLLRHTVLTAVTTQSGRRPSSQLLPIPD